MPEAKLPDPIKKALEKTCEKAVDKVKKAAPGEKNEKKLAELLNKKVCTEIDKKTLTLIAEALAKVGKDASAKAEKSSIPKVDAKPTMKKPGSGVPSLTLPLGSFDLLGDKKKDSKLKLKIWGDPRDFQKKEKGVGVYFLLEF